MKYRLVVFDVDGTLVDNIEFIWVTLHESFGLQNDPERIRAKEDFLSGKITYQQWADIDMKLLKDHGADRKSMLKALEKAELMSGTIETLKTLKEMGIKTAIISGSIDFLLEKLIPDYDEFFDYVFLNRIHFDRKGKIEGMKVTEFYLEHKKTGLLEICKKEEISPKEAMFVGDQENDIHIAEAAGFSIAFNSNSEKLKEVSNVTINKKDLRKILEYL
ncbi:MAG: HAD-IB family phosphatase [Candidatus Aenigmarchaeota archaeon]|nr:HAD-IB family phosphatase [Candidatus Aenigmarchaeota archaeon]